MSKKTQCYSVNPGSVYTLTGSL